MKKAYIVTAIAAVLFSACQVEEQMTPVSGELQTITVSAPDASVTKTILGGDLVYWESGDRLSFYKGNGTNLQMALTGGAGTTEGTFAEVPRTDGLITAGTELQYDIVLYPYSEDYYISRATLGGTLYDVCAEAWLPPTQEYRNGSFAQQVNLAADFRPTGQSGNYKLYNLLGGIELQLTGTSVIDHIELVANNLDYSNYVRGLCGWVLAAPDASSGIPGIIYSFEINDELVLDCGDGVQLSDSQPTSFFFMVPPQTLPEGVTFVIHDKAGGVMEKSCSSPLTVQRSTITPVKPFAFEPAETLWSVIGSIYGDAWTKDIDMDFDGSVWKTTIFFRDGQEFKIRCNHDWTVNRGYGEVDPRYPVVDALQDGANIILPHAGYWDVVYDPASEQMSFSLSDDVSWQYFQNPQTGGAALITFTQNWWGEEATGYIKYYEVDGIRVCKTETLTHCYNGEYYEGNGFFGYADNPGEGEWYFIWYTDCNLLQLPAQSTGYYYSTYDAYIWVYDDYALDKYLSGTEGLTNWLDAATAGTYSSGYYDGNGGFYLYVAMYYMTGTSVSRWSVYDDDIVAEAEGYVRTDYSLEIDCGAALQGTRDITFYAGRDVAEVRYVFLDEQITDGDAAWEVARQIIDGSIAYESLTDFAEYNALKNYATITYAAQVPGYHTVIAVSFDENGQDYYWYYYWFYLDPVETGTWTSIGTGTYTDDFFTTFWSVENLTWEVEIEQCNEDPARIRMVYPYDGKYGYNEEGDWDATASYDIEICIPDNDHVYIRPQQIGMDWGYGMISVASFAGYYIENGNAIEDLEGEVDFGTLEDGVITFPEKGLLISMADYNSGTWYFANKNTAFRLVLPGYDATATTTAAAPRKVSAPAKKSLKASSAAVSGSASGKGGRVRRPSGRNLEPVM